VNVRLDEMTVEASNGVTFLVRVVRDGDRYGRNACLTHDEPMPLVEFYDTRYPETSRGQFVSRYYADTVAGIPSGRGLDLDGGVPDWTIDGESMRLVTAWVRIAC
jgi:hypothetical protein